VGALGENVEKNKKLTAKGKKKIFLVQLTDDELLTMYLWVHAEYDILRSGISKKEVRKYFRRLDAGSFGRVMSFLSFKMFGKHEWGYQTIFHLLPEFRRKLAESVYTNQGEQKDAVSQDQEPFCYQGKNHLTAWNVHAGNVEITEHALTRFKERHHSAKDLTTQQLLKKFRELFQGAVPSEISPAHRVARIIENSFRKARYFLNTGANLRFVVLEDKPIIVTVERPR